MSAPGADLEAWIKELAGRRPVVGLAVGVVRAGSPGHFGGHGWADQVLRSPITEDTVFRIASITKTFTAIAVMQLHERGQVDLDGPVDDYLRAYRLDPIAGYRSPTVRHLLTHTGGLPEIAHLSGIFRPDFGESFPAGQPVPTLAEFYGGSLHVYAEPGTRFVYNNHGPATLGQLVEDVAGMPLDRYFREHIFEPLGMSDSDLLRSDAVQARLATGYEIRSGGVEQVAERDMVTAGAASIYSTPGDMARYLAALLGKGANDDGSILEPATLAMMFEPQYRPDPRVPGMGLGFFRADAAGHVVVRHQGTHPGFHSEMAVAPDDGVGVMLFTNGARQADFWLPAAAMQLLREIIGAPRKDPAPPYAHRPEIWDEICGWYRLDARIADIRLRGMIGAGAEVLVRGGRLMLRFLTPIPALAAGFPLEPASPDDPYVFEIDMSEDGMEPMRVVFGQDPKGVINRLHLDVMPVGLEKQLPATNPRRWVMGAVAGLGLAGLAARRKRWTTG